MYVEIAVNLPAVRGTFHYHLPPHLRGKVRPGHLVTAPFGPRRVQGVVVGTPRVPEVPETRPVEELLDPEPVLTTSQLQLARWLAEQHRAPLVECLTLMLPPGLSRPGDSLYTLLASDAVGENNSQRRLIQLLARRGPLRGRQIARSFSRSDWRRGADRLDSLVARAIRKAIANVRRFHARQREKSWSFRGPDGGGLIPYALT